MIIYMILYIMIIYLVGQNGAKRVFVESPFDDLICSIYIVLY